jgi:hypothetical protein
LFAALSYAVSSSFRGGTNTITNEQARIAAGDILRAMDGIKQGYDYLWNQQGCSMDEISFIKAGKEIGVTDFDAASPKSDESCDIFHPLGAGVGYPENVDKYQNDTGTTQYNTYANKLYFTFAGSGNTRRILDLGTSAYDHIIIINGLKREVCVNINKLLGYDNYNNDFVEGGAEVSPTEYGRDISAFRGKHAGCLISSVASPFQYQLFYVMQAL